VSGFNLAVVAGATFWIARFVPWKTAYSIVIGLGLHIGLRGCRGRTSRCVTEPTLAAMFLVIGKLIDRGFSVFNATAATAFILLVIDPTLIEDSSFQMTFCAVPRRRRHRSAGESVGIRLASRSSAGLRQRVKGRRAVGAGNQTGGSPAAFGANGTVYRRGPSQRHPGVVLLLAEGLVVSLAVEMVFAVFMVESFHRISPVSPLINVPAGLITTAVTPLALLLIFLPEPLSTRQHGSSRLSGQLNQTAAGRTSRCGASLRVPSPPVWVWMIYLVAAALVITAIHKRLLAIFLFGLGSVLSIQLAIAFKDFSPPPPKVATLTFLDVGQGDSTLIGVAFGQPRFGRWRPACSPDGFSI
jgi:predicted membrane metal-binding protein